MVSDEALSKLLYELAGIAQAPMTDHQREIRAVPVLTAAGVTVSDIVAALRRGDLPWNADRAWSHSVTQEQWQQAIALSCDPAPTTVPALLDALHRAEATAPILRAGYKPGQGPGGGLNWTR